MAAKGKSQTMGQTVVEPGFTLGWGEGFLTVSFVPHHHHPLPWDDVNVSHGSVTHGG